MSRAVGTEGGVDEDDLDDALRMEFPHMSTRSWEKLRDGNAFTEGAGSGEGGGGSSKSSDGIGTFLQNLLKPDRRAHIPTDEEQRGRSGGGGGVIDRDGLIEVLSSGGRRPLAFDPSTNPNSSDQIFRAQMISSYLDRTDGKLPDDISYLHLPSNDKSTGDGGDDESDGCDNRPESAMEAARRGIAFYSMLQTPDGHFAGDYGGPHFLLPGLVVAWYVMGRPSVMISDSHRDLMMHYLMVHQQEDGGWVSLTTGIIYFSYRTKRDVRTQRLIRKFIACFSGYPYRESQYDVRDGHLLFGREVIGREKRRRVDQERARLHSEGRWGRNDQLMGQVLAVSRGMHGLEGTQLRPS